MELKDYYYNSRYYFFKRQRMLQRNNNDMLLHEIYMYAKSIYLIICQHMYSYNYV